MNMLRPLAAVVVAASVCIALAAPPAGAVIRHVPSQYANIQAGVDAAVAGDTVLVAPGTYNGPRHVPPGMGPDTTRCVVHLKTGVSLIGSGPERTFIDPDSLGRGIHCGGVTSGLIEGFTIRRAFGLVYGSGILCTQASSPTIRNCVIRGCGDGAIIALNGSSPTITNCLLRDNLSKQGGAIAAEINCSPTVTNCSIIHNGAPIAGGVFVRDGSMPVFRACTIDSNFLNTVNGAGGGIAVRNARITLRRCTVNRNLSTGTGGGIDIRDNAYAVIESTYVQQNRATGGYGPGGGLYSELADYEIRHSAFTGNSSTTDGGGMFLFFFGGVGTALISNCTIAANAAPATPDGLGAGITCWFASPVIEKSIIAFNTPGKGMSCLDEAYPVTSCSDVYGNQDGDAICGTPGSANFSANPLFCDAANGVYVLSASSPCLPGQHPQGAPCGLIGAFPGGTCTGSVGGGAPAAGPHFATPNPSRGAVEVCFSLARAGEASLTIFDAAGRMVRELAARSLAAGDQRIPWDGRTGGGGAAPPGVYFYRIAAPGVALTGRIVLAR